MTFNALAQTVLTCSTNFKLESMITPKSDIDCLLRIEVLLIVYTCLGLLKPRCNTNVFGSEIVSCHNLAQLYREFKSSVAIDGNLSQSCKN